MLHRFLPLAALLLVAACSRPSEVAVSFHDALASRDGDRAFKLLSGKSQAALTKRAQEAHRASGGVVPDDPIAMIALGDLSDYPPRTPDGPHVARAELVSMSGPRAKVRVQIGSLTQTMELVRESGYWKVDLPVDPP